MGERWFLLIMLAIVCFSFGSFFGKVASLKDIPYRVYFFEAVGTLTVFTTFVIYYRNTIFTNFSVNFPALLMGLCWGVGTVLFYSSAKVCKAVYCGSTFSSISSPYSCSCACIFRREAGYKRDGRYRFCYSVCCIISKIK